MDDIVYKELSYKITGLCFQVQKELGRFCRERQYADRLEELLKEEHFVYQREFELQNLNEGSPKGNRVDFMIENTLILDAKAKPFITNDDYAQMQRYLRGSNLKLGLIVNFKDKYLKPKRVLNSHHSHTDSHFSHRSKGFTLIEMIVSIALFSFVMLATTTVLLSVVDANHKAQGLKTTINNLSLTLESVARNLRTGTSYVLTGISTSACPNPGKTGISYTNQGGSNVIYQHVGGSIQIIKEGTVSDLTAPEITIERFCFYINGEKPLDPLQPKILITVGGVVNISSAAGAQKKTTSRFDLQTLVSQRLPDVPR